MGQFCLLGGGEYSDVLSISLCVDGRGGRFFNSGLECIVESSRSFKEYLHVVVIFSLEHTFVTSFLEARCDPITCQAKGDHQMELLKVLRRKGNTRYSN